MPRVLPADSRLSTLEHAEMNRSFQLPEMSMQPSCAGPTPSQLAQHRYLHVHDLVRDSRRLQMLVLRPLGSLPSTPRWNLGSTNPRRAWRLSYRESPPEQPLMRPPHSGS